MNKWKIHKLSIDSFKVIDKFEHEFDSDLIVFDGPNGFGKTSIYDALQLLFCGSIPRIKALAESIKIAKNKQFENNLYWNIESQRPLIIKAKLVKNGESAINIMRKAEVSDLENNSNNKPGEFDLFNLYQLDNYDDETTAKKLTDDGLTEIFGEDFQKNYSVLNYMSQDNNTIMIPDDSNNKTSRYNQISHLLKLTDIEAKIQFNKKFSGAIAKVKKRLDDDLGKQTLSIEQLKTLVKSENPENSYSYERLTDKADVLPNWDKENPVINLSENNFQITLNLLRNIIENKEEIGSRLKNNQIEGFIKGEDFTSAVRLGNHIKDYENQLSLSTQLTLLNADIGILRGQENSFDFERVDSFKSLSENQTSELKALLGSKNKYLEIMEGSVKKKSELNNLRKQLVIHVHDSDESDCPLCGYDYENNALLIDTINNRTEAIEKEIGEVGGAFGQVKTKLAQLKKGYEEELNKKIIDLEKTFNSELLNDLEKTKTNWKQIEKIFTRLKELGIEISTEYSSDPTINRTRLDVTQRAVRDQKKPLSGKFLDDAFQLFQNNFKNVDSLKNVSEEKLLQKNNYINVQQQLKLNKELEKLVSSEGLIKAKLEKLDDLKKQVIEINRIANRVKTNYSSETIGQMEYLFHIYSGRLIQNYQRGLGLFINVGEQANTQINFLTSDKTYDAILSMSSGQIAALTLSFFLALNRLYAQTDFILIDDPTQSMDEINIASLSDILRVELRDRQVIISTHEQNVADYLRYRYFRAGLQAKSVNMQRLSA